MMKRYSYILLLIVALVFIACSKEQKDTKKESKKQEMIETGVQKTNKITLVTVNNEKIEVKKTEKGFIFSNAKDKIVLVSFFATWCPPCKAEIPHLNNLQEKYKGRLKIIGVLVESNKDGDELKNFINYHAINYIVTNSPSNQTLADAVGGVKNIPFMIMYDKKGDYVTHYLGAIPEEMIDSDIQMALEK